MLLKTEQVIEICKFSFQSCIFWADEFWAVRTQGMHCHTHSSGLHYAFLVSPSEGGPSNKTCLDLGSEQYNSSDGYFCPKM